MRERLPRHPTKVYYSRSMGDVTRVVIHHSGPAPLDMTPEEAAMATANYHINPHGEPPQEWPGCGYHVIIVPSGEWAYCQSLTTVSYHVGPTYNPVAVGVCLWGDYRTVRVQTTTIESLEEACRWIFAEKQNWASGVGAPYQPPRVVGHRELTATECPGDGGMAAVMDVRQRLAQS